MAGKDGGGKMLDFADSRQVSLPISRVKLIMKSSPDVSNINQDALFLTAKATELFVQYLATYSYKKGTGRETKCLTYGDLARSPEECDTFQFLADILPKKILARDYLKLLEEEEKGDEGDGEESDDSD
ncbi:chromatin accessibility complex protein 1 [Huso huso]|uniref:Chromatin accessibility complex protein 1 n=2 Tax=Acipenseridae TaxID=7900 RepID=A0A662YSP6_ACIRT|nr:chromatin accessibility complex protein 1 [Acipenser ruthenus]RXM99106.1 Chromatin accessibility complex protein 1 [Acipenser ruthenus]